MAYKEYRPILGPLSVTFSSLEEPICLIVSCIESFPTFDHHCHSQTHSTFIILLQNRPEPSQFPFPDGSHEDSSVQLSVVNGAAC